MKIYMLHCLALFCAAYFMTTVTASNNEVITDEQCCNDTLCCPYKGGVCCKDSFCCPPKTVCEPKRKSCVRHKITYFPSIWKPESQVPLAPVTAQSEPSNPLFANQRCSAQHNYYCAVNMTCCPLPYRGHDCCPVGKAVCCGDFLHCCPPDTMCDVANGNCVTSSGKNKPWIRRLKSHAIQKQKTIVRDEYAGNSFVADRVISCAGIHCPNNKTSCSDRDTCCLLPNNDYGCCPLPKAVCCSDQLHCCPANTQCDLSTGTCLKRNNNYDRNDIPILMLNVKNVAKQKEGVVCPDGKFKCPDWATCCPIADNQYACCPLPKAMCCSDKRHCCPNGSVCDVVNDRCNRGGMFMPFYKKQPACPL